MKKNKKNCLIKKLSRGQMLIEVLVALGFVVVVIAGVAATVATSLSNIQFSKNQNQATQYAQQGMEVIRSIRDSQITAFNALSGSYCLSQDANSLYNADRMTGVECSGTNVANFFKRQVTIEKAETSTCNGGTKVNVTVSWIDGKCPGNLYCHSANMVSCMDAVSPVKPI